MSRDDSLGRREFVALSFVALAQLLVQQGCRDDERPLAVALPPLGVDRTQLIRQYFRGADLRHVRLIGRVHADQLAEREGEGALVASWAESLRTVAGRTTIPSALSALDQRVRDDFETRRMVSLAGWQLARTELDLCALALAS